MIYCVEDDESARELMVYTLNASGFSAVGFANAESFWNAMKTEKPELILLDIMLPDQDGIAVLKALKQDSSTRELPVIMATAKGNEYDKVIGLDLGADDYLAKPFGMMELVSRVKAVLRRTNGSYHKEVLNNGEIEMNLASHTVTVDGKPVELTLKEFDLLQVFLENKGIVFTREQLLSSIWHTDYEGETRTVDVHVGTLRTKLGQAGNLINTVRGVGYKMEKK